MVAAAQNWPSFRGLGASGVADGQKLPATWDIAKGTNIAWKTPIPGLAHSSPIVWGDRVFVTTAVSSRPDAGFRRGLYGDGDASDDRSVQKWRVLCLNARTGAVLWDRLADEGVPKEKRHIKSTYASSTPATDGEVVVAFFGSQGLHAYDLDGRPLWTRDLGRIDAGAYDLPDYEWGTASSPVLYRDLVIVQCDQQKGDRAVRSAEGIVPRGAAPQDGKDGVEDGPGGIALVGHADDLSGQDADGAGHELAELHPRVRSADRQGAVEAGVQLEDHGADPDLLGRSDPGGQRAAAGSADLRHPRGRIGEHRSARNRRKAGRWRGRRRSAGHTCRRRSSIAGRCTSWAMRASSTHTNSRRDERSTDNGSRTRGRDSARRR